MKRDTGGWATLVTVGLDSGGGEGEEERDEEGDDSSSLFIFSLDMVVKKQPRSLVL